MAVSYNFVQVNFICLIDSCWQTYKVVIAKSDIPFFILLRWCPRELGVQRVAVHVKRVELQVIGLTIKGHNFGRVCNGVVVASARSKRYAEILF